MAGFLYSWPVAATVHLRLVKHDAAKLHFGAAHKCPNVSGQTILNLKSTGPAVHPHSLIITVADVGSVGFVDDCDVAVDTAVVAEVDVACFADVPVAVAVNIAEGPLAIENFFAENDQDPETYAVEPAAVCADLIAEGINLGQESFLVVTLKSLN